MLNYIAYRITTVVIGREDLPLVNPALQATRRTEAAELPKLLPGTPPHAGFIIAIIAAIVIWYLLYRTVFGYKLRTVGLGSGAAVYAGFSWGRTIAVAMLISGLLAGLGEAVDTLGLHGAFTTSRSGWASHQSPSAWLGAINPLASCCPASSSGPWPLAQPGCRTRPVFPATSSMCSSASLSSPSRAGRPAADSAMRGARQRRRAASHGTAPMIPVNHWWSRRKLPRTI